MHLEPELKQFALRLEQPREQAQCLPLLDKGRVDLMAISDRVMQEASYRICTPAPMPFTSSSPVAIPMGRH